jgi:hypothetical protein
MLASSPDAAAQPAQLVPAPNDTGRATACAQHRQRHKSTSTFAKHPNPQIGPSGTSHV